MHFPLDTHARSMSRSVHRLALIVLAGLAFGALMSLIKGSGGGAHLQFGNLSAPWLLVAFLAGARYHRIAAAATVGLIATFAALIGFYGEQSPLADFSASSLRFLEDPGKMYAFIVTPHTVVYLGGVVTGLVFGALGAAWSARRSRLALALVALMILGEPFAWISTASTIGTGRVGSITGYWWMWIGEIALGVALLAAALRQRLDRASGSNARD
jgi:hypothetical protein